MIAQGKTVWMKFNAGAGHVGVFSKGKDCQVRALCTALNVTYTEAWHMLYEMQAARRACSFELAKELHEANLALPGANLDLAVIREIPFPAQRGKKRMTATVFCKKYKSGSFILRMAHHVAAVKDGTLFDTWDSSTACIYTAWEIRPQKKEGGAMENESVVET